MAKILQTVPNFQLMLNDEQFRAIGHVAAQWAFLEDTINREIVWLLKREEHKGERVNFMSRFSTRTERWRKMASETYKPEPSRMKEVDQVIGHAINIKPERDAFAHGLLGSSGLFIKLRASHVSEISENQGQPKYIEDLACRISDINVEMTKHLKAIERFFGTRP